MSITVKITLPLLLATLLYGCDSPSNSVEAPIPPPVERNHFTGSAIKGVISNGQVDLYAIQSGQKGAKLASGSTTENGDYELSWDESYAGAILVEVTAKQNGETSLMTCDYPLGCGAFASGQQAYDFNGDGIINFAEKFPLPDSFLLRGLAPSSANGFYVTPLSHLIAETIMQDNISDEAIETAMGRTARFFGLSTAMFNQKPYDLSNLGEDDLTTENLTYTILNASLFGLSNNNNIVSALQNLAASAQLDGTLPHWSDNGTPSMRQFALLGKLVTDKLIQANPALSGSLGMAYANFQRLEVKANRGTGSVPGDSTQSDTEKAKQLFSDLRSVINVVDLQQDEISTSIQSLSDNATMAEEPLRAALTETGQVLVDIGNTIQTPITSYPYIGEGFTIEYDSQDDIYHATGNVNGQQFSFYYIEEPTSVLNYWGCDGFGMRLAISGSVESNQVKILIDDSYFESTCEVSSINDSKAKLSLAVAIQQKEAALAVGQTSPITFSGSVFIDAGTFSVSSSSYYYSSSTTTRTFLKAISLAGGLSDADGNSVEIEAHSNALRLYYYQYNSHYWPSDSYESLSYETVGYSDLFVPENSTISVGLELYGLPSLKATIKGVNYSGSRSTRTWWWYYNPNQDNSSHDENQGQLSLEFNNKTIDINMVDTGVFYISNQDGISLLLNLNDAQNSGVFGIAQIGEDAKVLGYIETTNDGLYMIRYENGDFETLF